jgi:predicted nucleic acid-binding protein
MSVYVVDASVVVKWFIAEVHSDAAQQLLLKQYDYLAPDLLFAEVINAVWSKMRRGQLSSAEGEQLARELDAIAVETVPCRALANQAYRLAARTGISCYDALYLALALRLDTQVITADERLLRTLTASPTMAQHIRSLQDFHRL